MNVELFVSILILLAVTGESATSCAAEEQPSFERHIVASHKDVEWNRYPSMARLDDGRLMVVWYSTREYADRSRAKDKDSVTGIFSSDHGRTWSKPVPLIRTPEYDLDPSILVSGSRVFVTATVVPDEPGITTTTTWCTRSEDNGRTWSDPYQIPMNRVYTCGKTQHGLRLKSGTLLMGYAWDILCEQGKTLKDEHEMHMRSGVMRSTDNGESWHNGGDVVNAPYKKTWPGGIQGNDEPAIVELEDGSIYMLMRTGSNHLCEARSYDEGKTWASVGPSRLVSNNSPAALCQFKVGQRRGIMCLWHNSVHRWPLCAAASFDGGKTWSTPQDIADGAAGGVQTSYPDCYQAADGMLTGVWQHGVPGETPDKGEIGRDVRFARFNLAWLLDDPPPHHRP